jgi:hypothetical protein
MKKKKASKRKQKIDIVLESLVNLEQKVKELIKEVENLKNKDHHKYSPPSVPVPMPTNPQPKYWPNDFYRYDGVTWTFHN